MPQLIKILQEISEIKLVGRNIGPFTEGEEVEVRPWEASLLEERGLAEPLDDYSTTVGLRKLLIAEEKSSQLERLPSDLYLTVSCRFSELFRREMEEEAEKLRDVFSSLVELRIQKLTRLAISSRVPKDLPAEESFLVNRISKALKLWRRRLDRLFEKDTYEEVGAHEGGKRRSIQRVVSDATDI